MKTLSEIVLPTDLPDLYIRKYGNLLQSVRVMVFLYATKVLLIKLIFYIKNKKAVDLKLQDRISRNNSFSNVENASPEKYWYNDICTVLLKQSSRGVLFKRYSGKGVFLLKLLKRDSSTGVIPWILRDILEHLFCIWLLYVIRNRCSKESR